MRTSIYEMTDGIIEAKTGNPKVCRQLSALIDHVFPEYAPTDIKKRLDLFKGCLVPKVKIFAVKNNDGISSFAQIIYKKWDNTIISDLDLIGTDERYRRRGLADLLFGHCRSDMVNLSESTGLNLSGLITFIDPKQFSIMSFHRKNGGQIRDDCLHDSGEVIVWYPYSDAYISISTSELLEQMQEFGSIIRSFTAHS